MSSADPSGRRPNPFTLPGRWWRGNTHTHTTRSDGQRPPAEVVEWYRQHGYDFVAITDHRRVPEADDLVIKEGGRPFCVVAGSELDLVDHETGVPYHLVCLGLSEAVALPEEITVNEAIRLARERAALVYVAHPYWHGHEIDDLVGVEGAVGIEIYNATCEYLNGKGTSVVHWDSLLRRGRSAWGFAADDAHWNRPDAGRAWVMVKAPALTPEAILNALAQGHFYSSTGPTLEDVEIAGDRIRVRCSPVDRVAFIGPGTRGRVVTGADGPITEAEVRLTGREAYLRVEAIDADGRRAWTNPLVFTAQGV
ncbi:MAG TPA: CehA/McbA family metallohydrolase [Limnochordia bacterium]